jgi:tetratricopeptide (TPR) repeat protein
MARALDGSDGVSANREEGPVRTAVAAPASTGVSHTTDEVVRRLREVSDADGWRRLLTDYFAVIDAETLLVRLKAESEQELNVDTLVSLRLADTLLVAAELADRPDHRALGLLAKGDALRALHRFREAVPLFDEGAETFLRLGDEVGWARSRIGWVWSMYGLGRGEEAIPIAYRAHEILVRHQQWQRAGNLEVQLAFVCSSLARYDEALALYARAQETYERLGPAAEIQTAWVKQHRVWLLTRRGDFRSALELYAAARETFVRHGQHVSVLRLDQYIAYAYAGQGHYTRALRQYGDVLAAHERAGLDAEAAWAAMDMVECYLALNRHEEALTLAEEAVTRFDRCGAPAEAAKARLLCALAQAGVGRNTEALAALREAADSFERAGLARELGIATLLRASLHLAEENWPAALDEAERAHTLFSERGMAVRQAQAELIQARARLGLEQGDQATDLARSALAIAEESAAPWLIHEGRDVLGGVARAKGDLSGALAEYEAAIASIERVQSRLATELRTHFLEDKLQVYHRAIDCCLRLGKPEQAFAYLERAKSRALVDYLARTREVRPRSWDAASRELAEELARLREEHAWFYGRLYGYGIAQRPEDEPTDAERAELQADVRDRERRIARVAERLALRESEAAPGTFATVDGEHPAPPAVDERTVLVEYYFADDRGAAFVWSGRAVEVVPLPAGSDEIRRLVGRWQLNLDAAARAIAHGTPLAGIGGNARGVLQTLYRALLAPLASHLAGRERLVVVPFGPTHWVPFHALHDDAGYLIEAREVSVCPSSSLLRLCQQRRTSGRGALVVGYSDGGRLPHVLDEARAVAALLPGECYLEEQATRAAVLAAAPRRAVLHLAAHGEARLDHPTFAHLKLADGHLGMIDVFNLELNGALVTLSACETGRSVVVGGDELIGLSRGFLYAGASTLVQSLWRVEDAATARLMERFYRALGAGKSKGAALREAQQVSLADDGAHPYLWAPFQIVGDGGA